MWQWCTNGLSIDDFVLNLLSINSTYYQHNNDGMTFNCDTAMFRTSSANNREIQLPTETDYEEDSMTVGLNGDTTVDSNVSVTSDYHHCAGRSRLPSQSSFVSLSWSNLCSVGLSDASCGGTATAAATGTLSHPDVVAATPTMTTSLPLRCRNTSTEHLPSVAAAASGGGGNSNMNGFGPTQLVDHI